MYIIDSACVSSLFDKLMEKLLLSSNSNDIVLSKDVLWVIRFKAISRLLSLKKKVNDLVLTDKIQSTIKWSQEYFKTEEPINSTDTNSKCGYENAEGCASDERSEFRSEF